MVVVVFTVVFAARLLVLVGPRAQQRGVVARSGGRQVRVSARRALSVIFRVFVVGVIHGLQPSWEIMGDRHRPRSSQVLAPRAFAKFSMRIARARIILGQK